MVKILSFTKHILPVCALSFHLAVSVSHAQVLTGFSLIRPPGTSLGPLPGTINLADVGQSLNIKAETSGATIDKVVFWFDGKLVSTERVAPYALGGDTNEKYYSFTPLTTTGTHTIVAEAYNARSESIGKKSSTFTVVKSTSPTPPTPRSIPISAPAPTPKSTPIAVPVPTPKSVPISVPAPTRPVPVVSPVSVPTDQSFQIIGELRKWHKVTLAFTGPFARETDTTNPFMDYRFDVVFSHALSGKRYKVPGYFAADGNAAETSASSGDQWYCHFAPDETGAWTFAASFVTGQDAAVSPTSGVPTSFHGQTGSFTIQNSNKTGRDHRGKGRLDYVGQHHMQFQETGEWFLKAGPDRYEFY